MTNPFAQFDKTITWTVALLAGCAGVVAWDQQYKWSSGEDYQFGYLVPFFFAYVLYDRWPQIKAILLGEPAPEVAPAAASKLWDIPVYAGLFLCLLGFFFGGALTAIKGPDIMNTFLISFAYSGFFLGFAWLLSEKNGTGRELSFNERMEFIGLFAFPALVWLISGPFVYFVDSSIRLILLQEVTRAVVAMLGMLDMNVVQEGNVIILPTIIDGLPDSVGVADACSGIRSLTACVFMGAFLSAIFVQGVFRKMALLALSAVFALILNVIRTGFLTLWAYKHTSRALDFDLWGNAPDTPEFTLGTVHDVAGYTAMGITFVLLIISLPLINLRFVKTDADIALEAEETAAEARKKRRRRRHHRHHR